MGVTISEAESDYPLDINSHVILLDSPKFVESRVVGKQSEEHGLNKSSRLPFSSLSRLAQFFNKSQV